MKLTLKIEYLEGSGKFVAKCRELKHSARGDTPDQALTALMANTENQSLILKRGEKERLGLNVPGFISEEEVVVQKFLKNHQAKALYKLRGVRLIRRALNGESFALLGKFEKTSKTNIGHCIRRAWAKAKQYMELSGTLPAALRGLYTYEDLRGYVNRGEIIATLNHYERAIRSQIESPLDYLRKAIMGHSYEQIGSLQGVKKAVIAKSVLSTWLRALAYAKSTGKFMDLHGMERIEDVRAGSLLALQVVNIYEQHIQSALK